MAKVEDCPGFETFGADVKTARKAKHLTRKDLAEKVNIESRYLANIENEGTIPSLPVVIQLIKICGLPVEHYFNPEVMREESEDRKRVSHKLKLCPEQYLPIVEGAIDGALKIKQPEEETEGEYDMYPLYWTPSRGGIIMRYTYEYKRKCVELYREGKWPETPEGVSNKFFRDKVRLWVRAEDSRGPEALKHKNFNRNWTPEERLELVSQVMSGKSCVSVAIEAGIQDRLLYQWVQNYKTKGYNGLVEMKKGRPSKGVPQMKKEEARPLNESEREELIRLRAENEYIKAENEVIKKEIALREERHAAQLKARKQRSSKSCVKKDTN